MLGLFNEYSNELVERGFDPIPLAPGCKHPRIKDWQFREFKPSPLFNRCGIGHRTHTIGAFDADITDPLVADKFWDLLQKEIGLTNKRIGKPPKWASLVWNEYGGKVSQCFGEHKLEFLGNGQQLAMYHIHPETRKPYEWVINDPYMTEVFEIPVIDNELTLRIFELFGDVCEQKPTSGVSRNRRGNGSTFREWEDKRILNIGSDGLRRDWVVEKLRERGLVLMNKKQGKYELQCPWSKGHSGGRKGGAVYYSPAGAYQPKFICLHESCRSKGRNYGELVQWLKS